MPVNHSARPGHHPAAPEARSPLADRVIFIDGEAIVLDKPAGLPVDAPRDGSLSLENHLASLTFGFQRWPLPVHRLDRDTSGCLLLARNPKAHKRFTGAFEAQQVTKQYVAILSGIPSDSEGLIDMALGKTSTAADGWRMVRDDQHGKAARTGWRVIAARDGRALILFSPQTGRTHQLRVHSAEGLGFGIVGDPVYGDQSSGPNDGRDQPLLLHALSIRVERGAKPAIEARAPIPDRFDAGGFPDAEELLLGALPVTSAREPDVPEVDLEPQPEPGHG